MRFRFILKIRTQMILLLTFVVCLLVISLTIIYENMPDYSYDENEYFKGCADTGVVSKNDAYGLHGFLADSYHKYAAYNEHNSFIGNMKNYNYCVVDQKKIIGRVNQKVSLQLVLHSKASVHLNNLTLSLKPSSVSNDLVYKTWFERLAHLTDSANRRNNYNYPDMLDANPISIDGEKITVGFIEIQFTHFPMQNKQKHDVTKTLTLELHQGANVLQSYFINFDIIDENIQSDKNFISAEQFAFDPAAVYAHNDGASEPYAFMSEEYKKIMAPVLKESQSIKQDWIWTWGTTMLPSNMQDQWLGKMSTGMVQWIIDKNKKLRFDFSYLNKYLKWTYDNFGMTKTYMSGILLDDESPLAINWFYDEGLGKYVYKKYNYASKEYENDLKSFVIALIADLRLNGIKTQVYLSLDETKISEVKRYLNLLATCDQQHILKTQLFGGWRFTLKSDDLEDMRFFENNVDLLYFGGYEIKNNFPKNVKDLVDVLRKFSDARLANGYQTYFYWTDNGNYPAMTIENDFYSEWWWPMWSAILNFQGVSAWAFNKWSYDPINDGGTAGTRTGADFFIYPNFSNHGINESIRLRLLNEGADMAKIIEMQLHDNAVWKQLMGYIDSQIKLFVSEKNDTMTNYLKWNDNSKNSEENEGPIVIDLISLINNLSFK